VNGLWRRYLGIDDGEGFAVQVKGIKLPMHDPRGKKGLEISYAPSVRGATHLEAINAR